MERQPGAAVTLHPARRTAIVLVLALVAAVLVALSPRSAGAQDVCVIAPVLRDTTVSQGIGTTSTAAGYRYLRRGKTTLVEAAISKPLCAEGRAERVTVKSATLDVTFPGRDVGQQLQNTITGPVFPELPSYSEAPTPNAPANPKFAVPGSALDSPATGRVTAQFTITVQYEVSTLPGIPQTVTLRPGGALSGPTVTADYEQPSNSLNLLVVVMGDPTKGFAANWPGRTATDRADGADDVLLRALQGASRLGPFKDGVANALPTAATSATVAAGLRYVVAPTIVDVRSAIGSDGKFCGNGSNFTYVRSQLSSFFNTWHGENDDLLVDKVVGVVWGPNSKGPATDATCAEGYAAVAGNQSWSRLVPDVLDSEGTVGVPSNGGNLITMETVGHNLGSVPQNRSASGDTYHSVLSSSAGTRGVNTSTRAAIQDAVSPLKYSVQGWDDYRTLLRLEDYAYTLCRLTPDSRDFCPVDKIDPNQNTTPVGSAATILPSVFTMAGTTDGTLDGTDIDTFLSPDTDVSDVPVKSEFLLVQRGRDATGEPILASTPFPVYFNTSEHHAGGTHEHPTTTVGTLEVRFAADPAAQVFEVYKGDPKRTKPIYRRSRDGAPLLGTASLTPALGGLQNQTADVAGGSEPALSPSTQLLVYTAPGGIVVKDLVSGMRSTGFVAGSAATWVDEDTLALVRDGSIYLREVTRAVAGPPVIGTSERVVYDTNQQLELLFAKAGEPTAHPHGTNLVTSINGDLWRIDLSEATLPPNGVVCRLENPTIAPCHRVTRDSATVDTAPSYDTDARVLFMRADGGASAVHALEVSGAVSTASIPGAQAPSASAPMVVYASEGGLGIAESASLEVKNGALTSGADGAPSLVGNALAFARTDTARTDVLTARWSNELSFSATDAFPARLRANVFASCDGIDYPIFVATPPSAVTADVASWELDWDGAGSRCTRPDVYALVNDGIDSVRIELGQGYGPPVVPVDAVGAIYAPSPGARILQYDSVALLGDVPGAVEGELRWRVSGPGYDEVLDFTRHEPALALPGSGGWRPGVMHNVQLLRGTTVLATGAFRPVADEDHDSIDRDTEERCFGPGADDDPTNAGGDADGDGERNFPDRDPCTSSLNVTVDLDANTLNTTSSGNSVTFYLSGSAIDLRTVPMASIAVTAVGGLESDLRATAYDRVTETSAVVKVSRQELNDFVTRHGISGRADVVLTGYGPAGGFRGFDPTDPTFS